MICPVCGKELPCIHGRASGAVLLDAQPPADAVQPGARDNSLQNGAREQNWRKEVASRVQLHRARRRRGGDANATMEFDFPAEATLAVTEEPVVRERLSRRDAGQSFAPATAIDAVVQPVEEFVIPRRHKLICFPAQATTTPSHSLNNWMPQPEIPQPPQQREEVPPRIVEAAESNSAGADITGGFDRLVPRQQPQQMELLPSFEDIQLEPGHSSPATQPEVIPRPASLQQRFFAGLVDVIAVALAAATFEFTFVRLAEDDPHSRMALLCGVAVSGTLWVLFQYLFLVHGTGTPGMRLARLELTTFEGKPASTGARRCRALASTLSALSIGLGYAWALFDEDQLGWHDRITGTLLYSGGQLPAEGTEVWD